MDSQLQYPKAMFRFISIAAAALALVTTAAVAHADYMAVRSDVPLSPAEPVMADSVISIGATTSMNVHDAIVKAPGKGKIVATANADVFCAGEETARSLVIDVTEESDVVVDFCQAHLDRRDVVIRFVPAS